jgi:hypothetical protein
VTLAVDFVIGQEIGGRLFKPQAADFRAEWRSFRNVAFPCPKEIACLFPFIGTRALFEPPTIAVVLDPPHAAAFAKLAH